jgi:hypothetical protein
MFKRLLATLAFAVVAAAPASAATITYIVDNTTPISIPGLTGFATTGAMMNGLEVTACFSSIGCETRTWAAGGPPNSGGVSGTNWTLNVTGDTFTAPWIFTAQADTVGTLLTLLLDGSNSFTIFDRTLPSPGTDGSAQGRDWDTALNGNTTIDVTYSNPTGIGAAAPVGDLFQMVFVDFLGTGPRGGFTFFQDTDNDSRFQVPEPSSLLLLGLGMLAMAFARRRRI